ncbi:TPA: hypothetical protein DD449_03445 [Candidatus Berkelbacteria bacterium]|uniref:Uncharacterized protein n=1 Tax=Berkelbacteria bacterium GW2011_GWE1_39_12 TaxID=1618337 RepID=A0A0G4B3I1_9BACT|nr:MAG: hypothetical protein UT28_C0001G0321 [Berkelbacteria bacterium GW2011_GWE1_39_12]HBO60712.1 hypothetical protein [Candidatus Berkelbacteria bacterium]
MKKRLLVIFLLILSTPLTAETIDIAKIQHENHFSQSVRQSENYQIWRKMGHSALAACHRGELNFNAKLLAQAIQHCELSDICPGLSLPETHKYLAKDCYYQCKQGKFIDNASNLQKYIQKLHIPLTKIDRDFNQKELVFFLSREKAIPQLIQVEPKKLSSEDVVNFLIAFSIPSYMFIHVLCKYGLSRKNRRHAITILKYNLKRWAEHKFHHTNWPTRGIYFRVYQQLE